MVLSNLRICGGRARPTLSPENFRLGFTGTRDFTPVRTLFARFMVRRKPEDEREGDIVEDLADLCWEWVKKNRSVPKGSVPDSWGIGVHKPKGEDTIRIRDRKIELEGGELRRFWRMDMLQWGQDDPEENWGNYIFIAKDSGGIEFSVLQDLTSSEGKVSPNKRNVKPPVIIRVVSADFDCYTGQESVLPSHEVVSPNTVDGLIESITDHERRLPILLMSKSYKSKKTLIEQAGKLSGKLAGLAHVRVLTHLNTKQFGDSFGKQWVANGSVRIYWPGTTHAALDEDFGIDNLYPQRHFKSRFGSDQEKFAQELINVISRATGGLRLSSPHLERVRKQIANHDERLRVEVDDAERKKNLDELSTATQRIDYFEEENTTLIEDRRELRFELEQKEDLLQRSKERVNSMEVRIDGLNNELAELKPIYHLMQKALGKYPSKDIGDLKEHILDFGEEESDAEPEPEMEFGSIAEALDSAKERFSGRITFLPSAFSSAEECNSDADPGAVFEVFSQLYDSVWPRIDEAVKKNRLQGRNRFNIVECMNDTFGPGKYAESEGGATLERYKGDGTENERYFPLHNQQNTRIQILPHIKFGNSFGGSLRIHVLCLHPKMKYKSFKTVVKKDGSLTKKHGQKSVQGDVNIIVGWCGNHLPT